MQSGKDATAYIVRAATVDDIDVIARFNAAMALETEKRVLDPSTLEAGVTAVFGDPTHGFYRVAERDGQVVACLLITFEWSDWRNGLWWWLQSVYVEPEHRGRGVFTTMYHVLRADAKRAAGVCGLRLYVERDNAVARQVYTRLGMQAESYRLLAEAFDPVDNRN